MLDFNNLDFSNSSFPIIPSLKSFSNWFKWYLRNFFSDESSYNWISRECKRRLRHKPIVGMQSSETKIKKIIFMFYRNLGYLYNITVRKIIRVFEPCLALIERFCHINIPELLLYSVESKQIKNIRKLEPNMYLG